MKGSQVLNWEFLLFGEGIFGKSMLKTVFRKTPKIAFLSACLVHATETIILDSNPENCGSHGKKSYLVQKI